MSYPEPKNAGKFLGVWLSFRVAGQVRILLRKTCVRF